MAAIEAVIFDYFGVICTDQYEAWLKQNKHTRTGQYDKLIQKTDSGELSMDEFFTGLSALSGLLPEQIEADFHQNTDIDHRLINLILKLKKHYKIGLLSNSSLEWISIAMDQFYLRPVFDEVVVSGEVGFIKPQPQIYQIMLERLVLQPEQVVFVDDNATNVSAAQKLGMIGLVYDGMEELRKNLVSIGVKV